MKTINLSSEKINSINEMLNKKHDTWSRVGYYFEKEINAHLKEESGHKLHLPGCVATIRNRKEGQKFKLSIAIEKKEGFTHEEYQELTGINPAKSQYECVHKGRVHVLGALGNISAQLDYSNPIEELITEVWTDSGFQLEIN